jgi:hypothetical protein
MSSWSGHFHCCPFRSGDDNCRLVVDAAGRALALWVGPTGEVWSARFE